MGHLVYGVEAVRSLSRSDGAGENSSSGPQPYQPYEAEVTNSPISNMNIQARSQQMYIGGARYIYAKARPNEV